LSAQLARHEVVQGNRNGIVPKGIDIVIDNGAYGNLYSQDDISAMLTANYYRVVTMLDTAQANNVQRVILTSSSSVTLPTQTAYSATKVLMEHLAKKCTVPISIIRPHKPYGIGDDPEHLIPKVFESCLKGIELTIDPKPVHDYVWVDDYNALVRKCLETQDSMIKNSWQEFGEAFEIGTGIPTTNLEIVTRIEKITGKPANYKLTDVKRSWDNRDWYYKGEPLYLPTTLDEGLQKIYGDIKQRLKT
jgi:nucleoside-diphosphate-sugar epimerase